VAGLRGALKNKPDILENLVSTHKPDLLCLQETKLQESHVSEFEGCIDGYIGYWTCSTTKKGYSGNAVFVKSGSKSKSQKKHQPQQTLASMWKSEKANSSSQSSSQSDSNEPILNVVDVAFELKDSRFSGEGRTITIELDDFFLVACYVPNSGQKLERLSYRVNEWDVYMRQYLKMLEGRGKPVVFTGDLNVGHLDIDIWNFQAKHIPKQAGLTPEERNNQSQLLKSGFVDAFRWFYPTARGQFTYWSMRTMARPVNRGIRLDYFICSDSIMPTAIDDSVEVEAPTDGGAQLAYRRKAGTKSSRCVVVDSYILHEDTIGVSDHCPVVLIIEINA